MTILLDLAQDEEAIVLTAAREEGLDPAAYVLNLVRRHLRLAEADSTKRAALGEPANEAKRVGNLHPGSFRFGADFDEPLPEEFWLGTV